MGWLSKNEHSDLDLKLIHDLKSPLTCIEGYSQRLLKSAAKGAIDQEALKKISYCSRQAIGLARDLSDRRAMESGRFSLNRSDFFLEGLLAETGQGFEVICQSKGVCLEIDLPHRMTFVHADPQRIGQVVGNLLSNAIRHTGAGGTVRLGMELEGGSVKIVVQDDGDGIDPRVQKRIFEAFYQGKNGGSSGLGLSICSEIVGMHGGKIGVQSEGLGKGSQFYFTIPLEPVSGVAKLRRTQPWAMAASLSLGGLSLFLAVLASRPEGVQRLSVEIPESAQTQQHRLSDAPAPIAVSRMLAPRGVRTPQEMELDQRSADAALARIESEFEDESAQVAVAFDGNQLRSNLAPKLPVYAAAGRKEFLDYTPAGPIEATAIVPAPRVKAGEENRISRAVALYGGTFVGLVLIGAPLFFRRRDELA